MDDKELFDIPQGSEEEWKVFHDEMDKQVFSLPPEEYEQLKIGTVQLIEDTIKELEELKELLDIEIAEANKYNIDKANIGSLGLVSMSTAVCVALTNLAVFQTGISQMNADKQSLAWTLVLALTILESIPLSKFNFKQFVMRPLPRAYHKFKAHKVAAKIVKLKRSLYIQQFILKTMNEHDAEQIEYTDNTSVMGEDE